jgi:hypothetical protein
VTRETRANLLFLGLFLAISLPGGVILFKKKLDPSLRPSYLPPQMPTRIPFNDPREGPRLERYVPPQTGQWVNEQARAHGLQDAPFSPALPPLMSERRRIQVVGARDDSDGLILSLLLWDEPPAEKISVTARRDGRTFNGVATDTTVIGIPENVRRELIVAGFAQPPKHATWLTVTVPDLKGNENPTTVLIDTHENGVRKPDSVTLFTK